MSGYVLTARQIKKSWVAHASPTIRDVWNYLYREANFKDRQYRGFLVKRGQLFRSVSQIREDLHWYVGYRKMTFSEDGTKHALKTLRIQGMITLTKTPRGNLITVLNYDKFQDPKFYETPDEDSDEYLTNSPSTPFASPSIREEGKKNEKNEEGEGEKISPTPAEIAKEFFEDHEIQGPLYQQMMAWLEKKGVVAAVATAELQKFCNYWTEKNKSGTKQRWQMEKTFEVNKRLATWFGNVKSFSGLPAWQQEQEKELAKANSKYFGN